MRVMRNEKGFTFIELAVAVPLIVLVVVVLYNLLTTVYTANIESSESIAFYSASNLLTSQLYADIAKGYGELSYIDAQDTSKGFIVNSQVYDFTTKSPVDFSLLGIVAEIHGSVLSVTTRIDGHVYTKVYDVSVWGGNYE